MEINGTIAMAKKAFNEEILIMQHRLNLPAKNVQLRRAYLNVTHGAY